MVSIDLIEVMRAIGFTEYEARVYLALLKEHPATGYSISKTSGVPRSMVYEALGRLDRRGVVLKTIEEKATLYRPLPPDTLLEEQRQEHRERMHVLARELGQLYKAKDEGHLWTLTSRVAVLGYSRQMIQSAQVELMLVLADPELEDLRDEIRQVHQRGVKVSVLLTGDSDLDFGQVARHPPLESELQELVGNMIVTVDQKETLIASSGLEVSATVTGNPDLVFIARQFIWMELFAQRVYARIGPELMERLDEEDRKVFEGFSPIELERTD
jgi:sugar-specific transcriptional regulator TrmB